MHLRFHFLKLRKKRVSWEIAVGSGQLAVGSLGDDELIINVVEIESGVAEIESGGEVGSWQLAVGSRGKIGVEGREGGIEKQLAVGS